MTLGYRSRPTTLESERFVYKNISFKSKVARRLFFNYLGSDLVSALASLDVDDLAHFVLDGEGAELQGNNDYFGDESLAYAK